MNYGINVMLILNEQHVQSITNKIQIRIRYNLFLSVKKQLNVLVLGKVDRQICMTVFNRIWPLIGDHDEFI